MSMSKRNVTIDILKGIGIISIVVGHACWEVKIGNLSFPIGPFVYLYHLTIFFFCAGYCYKADSIDNYLIKKIKSLYIPFILYSLVFLIFRNLFLKLGILDGIPYSFEDLIIVVTNILTFNGNGEFLSAFWFLPVLFGALIIFCIIDQILKKTNVLKVTAIILILFLGYIGLYSMEHHFGLLLNMQVAYLMIPIVTIGYMYKRKEEFINKLINIFTFIACLVIMVGLLYRNIGIIELSKFMIISKSLFYPVSFIGILFCLSLAKIISKHEWFKRLFSYIGVYSFDIMALHFLSFKIVDLLYYLISRKPCVMSAFPYSYNEMRVVYVIVGIAFPVFLKKLFMQFKKYLNKNILLEIKSKLEENHLNN
mgnify:FL=1